MTSSAAAAEGGRGANDPVLRIARTILLIEALASLLLLAFALGPITQQSAHLAAWYFWPALVVVFGLPLAAPIVARITTSSRTLFRFVGFSAIAYLVVVAAFLPAITVWPIPGYSSPWPLGLTALGTVQAALAWRPAVAWVVLTLNAALVAPVRFFATNEFNWEIPLQDALFTLVFSSVFTALAIVSMANARRLDRAIRQSNETAAELAAVTAVEYERTTMDALVHDHVVATLFAATTGVATPVVARQARRAIDAIADARTATGETDTAAEEFVRTLEQLASDQDVEFERTHGRSAAVPAPVAAAMLRATGESIRNSRTHAARPDAALRIVVDARLADDGITVRITDDGVGIAEPLREGFGLRESITLPLESVGGAAVVTSTRGRGTVVELTWADPT